VPEIVGASAMQKARRDFSPGLGHSPEGYTFMPETGFNVYGSQVAM
jgi:hypothetical protein